MQKFEHKLRTTVHTRSVQKIMTRNEPFFQRGQQFKLSQPKLDNITTYLRKFQIERENLNLAKRIMQCQSEHNRDKYVREWKKIKTFMKVRSNFKPQLSAKQPKIFKFAQMPGHGRLSVKVVFEYIGSNMKLLNSDSLYFLKFNLGGTQLVPNKQFFTLCTSEGYTCQFLAPVFLRGKSITIKLIKVIENSMFEAGRFVMHLSQQKEQQSEIYTKMSKVVGTASFSIETEVLQKTNKSMTMGNKENMASSSRGRIDTEGIRSVL